MTISGAPDWLPNVRPQADYDLIFHGTWRPGVTSTLTVTPLDGIYQSVIVEAFAGVGHVYELELSNSTAGVVFGDSSVYLAASDTGIIAWLPFLNVPGDSLELTMLNASGGFPLVTASILGVRSPVPPNVRKDGRCYPQGENVTQLRGSVSGTLLTAPTSPYRFLIKSLEAMAGFGTTGNATEVQVLGTLLTVPIDLADSQASDSSIAPSRLDVASGVLLDPATAVTVTTIGTLATDFVCRAVYDIVR